jgi:hypothetical protein
MELVCRSSDPANFNANDRIGIDATIGVEKDARARYGIPAGR